MQSHFLFFLWSFVLSHCDMCENFFLKKCKEEVALASREIANS